MNSERQSVAIFFGGRSPEHDVSVVSGLQVLQAIDSSRFDPFPVYITTEGRWLVGDVLRDQDNFLPDASMLAQTREVTLDVAPTGRGRLLPKKPGLFGGAKPIEFDVAVPAFHGLYGEDGQIQGLFEMAGVPYTGMRTMATSLLMDKEVTKHILSSLQIPFLPCAVLDRPAQGYIIEEDDLKASIGMIGFPCIVKPSHLGSSIGVAKAENLEEAAVCLPAIFEYDDSAIVEPFVPNLVEYNVSVSGAFGDIRTSAIERPKASKELLDFKQKYMSGEGGKTGTKSPGQISEGMLAMTRELNPKLDRSMESDIRGWSERLFAALGGTGAPRIDYLCNAETGELFLNEVNPIPGSFGYFLWEAAEEPVLFTALLTHLIEEAFAVHNKHVLPRDPVPVEARLLKRP